MFYAVSRTKELYHVPADHKVDVLGMQPRAWWSISRVLTINRDKLLCRNAQTANWYLILNFLWYRYKKWICPYAQQEKRWKVHDYKLEKMWFSRVRAPRACPHNFYFDHCVYNTLVICFTKEFLWNFVQEKFTLKNSENMLFFAVFWKWLKYESLARKVRTQNNKNPRDTILYYVLFDSFDIISYHVTHYLESL